ncbi:MAG TPA: exo-alpha-sialidase [Phycisphaeraceae bacterium]
MERRSSTRHRSKGHIELAVAGLALLLAAQACVAQTVQATTVIAFGDSTTAPRMMGDETLPVYPYLLANDAALRERNVRVINAGVPGNTTADARRRFQRDVLDRKPNVVIIQFGINDAAVDVWKNPPATGPRVPLADYTANLAYFIDELRQRNVVVLLMTPNPLRWTSKLRRLYGQPPYQPDEEDGFNVLLKDYAQAVRELAQRTNTPLIDVEAAFRAYGQAAGQSIDDLLLDGMHPNAKGHRIVADLIAQQLVSMDLPTSPVPASVMERTMNANGIELDGRVIDMPGLKMGPFIRLRSGEILTVENTNCLVSNDEGKTWQAYPMFVDPSAFKISNERAILQTKEGVVIVAFMNMAQRHWTWSDELGDAPRAVLPTYVIRSTDDGKTWETPQKLHDDWTGAIRDILETRSGRIVFTSMKMAHQPGRHTVLTYGSDDQGRTWQPSNVIDLGGAGHHGGVMEPTIEQLEDGRLLMLIRTNWGQFWQAESTDDGRTWHPYGPSGIPASSAPALLSRLSSGRLMLLWNRPYPEGQSSYPLRGGNRILSAVPTSWHRGELSIAFSSDEGHTWSDPVVIARKPGVSLAYPYVFEARPGEIWITTMQGGLRIKLNEKDFIND